MVFERPEILECAVRTGDRFDVFPLPALAPGGP